MRFTRAIVRPPGSTFARGLVREPLGTPSLELALLQHQRYCDALLECGLALTRMPASDELADAPFVEDTALIARGRAITTRPGAPSRLGEVTDVHEALVARGFEPDAIREPGTLDAGDICEAGDVVFIGVSDRTNDEGARQLATWLRALGLETRVVDVRGQRSILHLKSGVSWLGDGRLLVIPELAGHAAFEGFEKVVVDAGEAYAANAVRVNDRVLLAAGHPRTEARLRELGLLPLVLDMSEFAKLDGGLSCLSLRF